MSFHTRRLLLAGLRMLFLAAIALGAIRDSFAVDPAVTAAEAARVTVVNTVAPTVVAIFSPGGQGGGSGVLITPDGFALSNFHVTSGAGNFMKCGLKDGRLYDAVIVGIDPTGDVALIKLLGQEDFPFATLGDSETLQTGDEVMAMGNPFLLATDFAPTVTYGIVSGVHRYQEPAGTFLEYTDCIQIDASINPGNSGGPLFNMASELVGINGRGSFEKRGRVNSGAGYAISINQIKHFIDALRGGLIVDHATLGATVGSRDDGSVVVTSILEKSEAFRRGLRVDDEIVSFAGRPIRSVNQFKNVLGIYPKGWKLPIVYRREGRKQEIFVRLRALHRQSEMTFDKKPKPPEAEPEPGSQPGKDEKPPGEKKGKPGAPPRPRGPGRPQPAKVPEHLAKLLVERSGFANFYFNQIERDRSLRELPTLGDFSKETGFWKLQGALVGVAEDSPFEFTLSDKVAGLTLDGGKKTFAQEISASEYEDEPPGTGGLLLALHQLRLLFVRGHQGFSEFYYQGSEPLDGNGATVDVLFSERYGARTQWYFSREGGLLIGFDTYRDDDVDPCEVRVDGMTEHSGRRLPAVLIVRHAGKEFGRFRIDGAKFGPPVTEPATKSETSATERPAASP